MREIDLEAERIFENRKALGEDVRGAQSKFYWATATDIDAHKSATYEEIKDKEVLEIGCASGHDAKDYTQYSKSYIGLDISDEAINNCNALDLKNSKFVCDDGHTLPFGDDSFDCVIVNSLLHHLDLKSSFDEISRVLKKGGTLIFREPLGTNPLIQLYRYSTPKARTVDERPFTFEDLSLMRSYFALQEVQWFGFLNILSAFARYDAVRTTLSSIDKVLSKTPLKYFFWQFAGVARKLER